MPQEINMDEAKACDLYACIKLNINLTLKYFVRNIQWPTFSKYLKQYELSDKKLFMCCKANASSGIACAKKEPFTYF